MPTLPNLRGYGLTIQAELSVPGALPIDPGEPDASRDADLQIVMGSAAMPRPKAICGPYQYADDAILFERPGAARYLCEAGRRIVVEPFAGASDVEVCGSLVATALPAALWMRGDIVLHAAAVQLPGQARLIAIGGASGSGKSTVLAQLIKAGAQVVGDDTLCLREIDGVVHVSGLPTAYFKREPGSGAEERALIDVPERQQAAGGLMSAFAYLAPRVSGRAVFTRSQGLSALEVLLNSRHRPRVPRLLGTEAEVLRRLAGLVERLGVYAWRRREGAEILSADEVAAMNDMSSTDYRALAAKRGVLDG
jgi:hypothetical protein